MIFNGSSSISETSTERRFSRIHDNFEAKTFRNPRSVLECSQSMTDVPVWIASRTSWWDISPVIHKSALDPAKTLDPDPAHTAMDCTFDSEIYFLIIE